MTRLKHLIIILSIATFFLIVGFLPFSAAHANMDDYCKLPPFVHSAAPPNTMIMLSIETPMQGASHPDVTCTGDLQTNYGCSPSACRSTSSGRRISNCYDNSVDYYGFFNPDKCYSYLGSGNSGRFRPSGDTSNHQCSGNWSGNFLNWATTMAVDAFRRAMTGGNRVVDSDTRTLLLGARQTLGVGHSWYPIKMIDTDTNSYIPYSGTRYIVRHANGFSVCSRDDCTVNESGTGETRFPTTSGTTYVDGAFNLRIIVCNPSRGLEEYCNPSNNKPEGVIQENAEKMRFSLISYAMYNNADKSRDGGIIRANMKWILPKIPTGFDYHDSSGNLVSCGDSNGCTNPEAEINEDGTFISNPDNFSGGKSGLINFINKFGYEDGYKSYDPISEMYYEIIRYFKNLGPSTDDYCNGLPLTDDGFPVFCNQDSQRTWRDPYIYNCQQSAIVAINDANPWLDKRIPGTSFTSSYGSYWAPDPDDFGTPSNADSSINVTEWTKNVGDDEGITPGNMCVGCVLGGVCDWNATDKFVSNLGEIAGTCPWPPKENSYYIAGLSYYAHNTDLRPDNDPTYGLEGNQTINTYMIDTQESNATMLVGRTNMLYLAAKFGGFNDVDGDGKPFMDNTCGTASPDQRCSEWDKDGDGFPDNYFFASEPDELEKGLKQAFFDIASRVSSGTSVSILSERTEKGANMIQAVFYPAKSFQSGGETIELEWIGYLNNLWLFNSKDNVNIREDTVQDSKLNLVNDRIIDFVFKNNSLSIEQCEDTDGDGDCDSQLPDKSIDEISAIYWDGDSWEAGSAIWEAGYELYNTSAEETAPRERTIYTNGTNGLVEFITGNKDSFKDYMGLITGDDIDIDGTLYPLDDIIKYIRGIDTAGLRNRTLTIGSDTYTWKLGDIIYSTPQVEDNFENYADTVVFVGANDGMLHAFKLGKPDTTGLGSNEVIKLTGSNRGKEIFAFIPRNSLPYLRYLSSSEYCHLYYVDHSPYITTIGDKKVLIGGMRLGGACGDGAGINPPTDTCPDDSLADGSCTGLSSYYALDISDPDSPNLLWEYSHPTLGFSYTGPAVITRGNTDYVMFLSGPTGYDGDSNQNLHVFVLKLNSNLSINQIFVKDMGSSFQNSFGGRLFTNGLDIDENGNTDFVLFGYSKNQGANNWSGGIVKVYTGNTDPNLWVYDASYYNLSQQPITARVTTEKCFDNVYVFAGTGRYFTSAETYSTGDNDIIIGAPFTCDASNNCNPATVDFDLGGSGNVCASLTSPGNEMGWYKQLDSESDAQQDGYHKERVITDPTTTEQDMIFFTTTEPSADKCAFGGRTRVWGLNCTTGGALTDQSCTDFGVANTGGTLFLQTSTSEISQFSPGADFTQEGGNATGWTEGVPAETSTPFLPPPLAGGEGEIIHWIER